MRSGLNALKEWTGKETASIVYNSTADPFTDGCLFDRVKGKENIAIFEFTRNGDVFGGFYSVAATQQHIDFDPNIFVFSLESHGWCETPQCFMLNETMKDNAYVSIKKRQLGLSPVLGKWCWLLLLWG